MKPQIAYTFLQIHRPEMHGHMLMGKATGNLRRVHLVTAEMPLRFAPFVV
jgi:hypothetical protein